MKVKVSFEIDYEEPESESDYNDLMTEIKNHYEENQTIPMTEQLHWLCLSPIVIESRYEAKEAPNGKRRD